MNREDLHELHYITPICNVDSIMSRGILSHNRAEKVPHSSVAMQQIQDRRTRKVVPGARPLHDYVNLYICARNPMLYRSQAQHSELCVLRVSTEVLDLPAVIVTDGNAAGRYARFAPAPNGLGKVDKEMTFAENWTHPDQIEGWRRKAAKCAEVLVPDCVPPRFVVGAYVSCEEAKTRFEATGADIPVTINSNLFFR